MSRFREIIEKIESAEKILLFTHSNMDGDAAGSSCALCKSLRKMGKECYVLLKEPCPGNLAFLDGEDCFTFEAPWTPDLCIAVDCGDFSRIEGLEGVYRSAPVTLCIDHHIKTGEFAMIDVVDPDAPAAGSLVLELLRDMQAPMDKGIAEDLYVAIATDTGSFRYENADAGSLRDAASLYAYGIDHAQLCNRIWGNYPLAQLKLEALAVERAEVFAAGKAAVSWCLTEDLERFGALPEHMESCIDRIRSIAGVEAAAFIKERVDEAGKPYYKVSFRSKSYANVNDAARALGGGGHEKASGCTLKCSLQEAMEAVKTQLERVLS